MTGAFHCRSSVSKIKYQFRHSTRLDIKGTPCDGMVYTLWLTRKADHCIWKEADRCFRKKAKFWKERLNLLIISLCTRWIEDNRGWTFTFSGRVQDACTLCYLGSRLFACVREYRLYGAYKYTGPVRQVSIDPFCQCQCVLHAIVSDTSNRYSYSRTTASNL